MTNLTFSLIETLVKIPPELLEVFLYLVLASSILFFFRLFGKAGLYAYTAVAIILGNLQVLKAAQFSFYDTPIALGTTTFASIFCVSDILTEHYGKNAALKGVWIGFMSAILVTLTMVITLGMKPIDPSLSVDASHFRGNHEALLRVFTPAPAILTASLIAYLTSQYTDIIVFQCVKKLTHEKWLWLRANVSSILSALLDNTIFSVCAWMLFSTNPVSFQTLFYTYILGGLVFRVVAAIAFSPLLYASHFLKPTKEDS